MGQTIFLAEAMDGDLTIDTRGEVLAADFTAQVSNATLAIDFHGNGFFVVTEETGEIGGKRLFLDHN